MRDRSLAGRFWSRVDKTSRPSKCWIWTGTKNGDYGAIINRGKRVRAHRVAYELERGPIPDGLFVCHHCDNPLCVRPDHLFLGTALHNNLDRVQKGRSRHAGGELHYRAKLTWDRVRRIRADYAAGTIKHQILADEHGVSRTTIRDVIKNRIWREPSPRN
jgi:hypothetical protein